MTTLALLHAFHHIVTDLSPIPSTVRGMKHLIGFMSLVVICVWPLVSTAGIRQTGIASGSIKGAVNDASGAVIPGVSVRAHGLTTGFERMSQTNEFGQFELPVLPLGTYEVEATASGFATFRQSPVAVELDKASNLSIRLTIAATSEVVAVDADDSLLNSSSFEVAGRLDQREMENMLLR